MTDQILLLKWWKYCIVDFYLGLIEGGSIIGIDGEGNSSSHSYSWAESLNVVVTLFLIEIFDRYPYICSKIVLYSL